MAMVLKANYMFNAIPIKIPMTFIRDWKINQKLIWRHKSLWIAKAMLSKKLYVGDTTTPNFKLYYRAIAIKTVLYWYEDQWHRTEDPDMNPCSEAHVIFDKGIQNIQCRKDSLFNNCCWENWTFACRKLKLGSFLSPCTSIDSK
jgi:hypothetical protein